MGSSEQNRAAAAAATVVAAVMIAQQVAGKAVRDALFLSNWPAENLPAVMAVSAVLSLAAAIGFTKLIVRHSPARIVPVLFVVHGTLYFGEWLLARSAPGIAAVTVYVHSSALGATVVSGFWSVINERFDPHAAKRFISRIAGGATAGGIVGGVLAWQASQFLDLASLLLVLVVANIAAAYGTARMAAQSRARTAVAIEVESGRQVMREVPYLRHVALLVVSITAVEACIDYVFKAEVKAQLAAGDLITFFAIFHALAALATFTMQTTLARRSLHRLGLAGTVATLPITNVLGALISLLVPGIGSVVGLRGASTSMENSLYRSGYELLYTPLTPGRKRPTKTLIDVGADRFGSLIGSGLVFAAIWAMPAAVRPSLLIVAMVIGTLALIITGVLHRGYVSALADSLRRGALRLVPEAVEDATTLKTLADTSMALDRAKLMDEIAKLREISQENEDDEPLPLAPAPVPIDARDDGVAVALAALRSGRADAVRRVFSDHRKDYPADLIPSTIELLARDDLHHQVIVVLRRIARGHIGQLCDALLDPTTDFAIRRRIPRVLVRFHDQRAVDGLMQGLGDERFEVRYRCGLALYRLTMEDTDVFVEEANILDAALREAERGEHVWRSQKILDTSFDETEGPFLPPSEKVSRSLEHVFTILSLVLERESLQLAYRALASDEPGLRGTGLEYLENVLPVDIRDALWPFLGDSRVQKGIPRDRKVVTEELLSSMSLDVNAVRKAALRAETEDLAEKAKES